MTTAEDAPAPGRARFDESGGRGPSWFRARLALRLALPIDRVARRDAARLAWSAVLAAVPVTVWIAAPVSALGAAAVLGLACAALPGVTATAWSATRLYDCRADIARALRQVGAEQRSSWLMAAVRVVLFAGAGALVGGMCVIVFHRPLGRLLPRHSPLRPMFAAHGDDWSAALAATVILTILGALSASSPAWRRLNARTRTAYASAAWSRAVTPVRTLLEPALVRARRAVRRPR